MSLSIEIDGEDAYVLRLAPQNATDIVVQVFAEAEAGKDGEQWALITFSLGELLRNEIEDRVNLKGVLLMSDDGAAVIERWAVQLECYARILRAGLKPRSTAPYASDKVEG